MAHLDHIIVLVPYASLADPPAWITKNFTITPGGQHADCKTENRLICFRDGSYIELIAFVNDDPGNREGHGWGDRQFGIIDFAFTHSTGDASTLFSELQERLDSVKWKEGEAKVEYEPPRAGGRKRPDGIDVKWTVTWPVVSTGYQRGELPFFCHDVTPRSVRVPVSEEAITHSSGVYGIKQLTIFVPESRVGPLSRAYTAIAGVPDSSSEDSHGNFQLKRLTNVDGTKNAQFNLQTPTQEWQVDSMRKRGGLFLGALTFGGQITSDGTETSSRIDDEKGGVGEIYLDLERPVLGR
ncbi:glyoxalase-like domain-containing protein [Leptodontidium sp. 2 PMI_412]|nr:glyoxalase-like domain-containing protein [Leptodontidium sp. MPI-SDFR-AT-0119]KAH9219964.1 glyoxalase-like domain-containing protein [Leptodontidium sp. 2 PMI_412]